MFSNFFGSKRNTIAGSGSKKDKDSKESSKDEKPNSLTLPKSLNESGSNFITSPSNYSTVPPPTTNVSPISSLTSSPSSSQSLQSQQQSQSQSHQGVITSLQMKPSCTNLTDDIEKKKAAKYDSSLEATARKWVCDVLSIELDESKSFYEHFRDGVLLCNLVNKLKPGIVKKVNNNTTISFRLLENIENYLKACISLGLQSVNLFNSIDLFENKDISLVITNIVVLGKHASKIESYQGIHLAGEKKVIKIITTPASPLFGGANNSNNNISGNLSPNSSTSITSAGGNALNKSSTGKKAKWRKSVKIPAVSSLNSDIITKEAFKFSPELQKAAQDWIEEVVGEKFKLSSFSSSLKDGILLCRVINTIIPSTIKYINSGNSSFKKMENISNYLNGCLVVGLKKTDLFDTPDLFEEKNINLVISNIHVLGNYVGKFYASCKLPCIRKDSSTLSSLQANGNSPLKMYSSIIHSKFGSVSTSASSSQSTEEIKDLKDWINHHIKAYHSLIVSDMSNDLRNGVVLLTLIEELTLQKVGIFTREPVLPWSFMQNICMLLCFLRDNSINPTVFEAISAHDLFNGDLNSTCTIVKLIREQFDRDHLFKSIPMDTRRQKVIEEIIATESNYVKSLSTVYNSLIVPLLNSIENGNPILSADEIFSIFGNWEHLLRSHINLLKEFKFKLNDTTSIDDLINSNGSASSNGNGSSNNNGVFNSNITIGDVFLEKCEFLKDNYTNYINNYDNSYQRVKRLRKGNIIFEELVNTFEIFQDSNNGLDLYSYLIMPIQRIVRYILLLKELIKYTPPTHTDHQLLQNAKENIKKVADHVNESKMEVENKRKISSIQDSIQSIPIDLLEKERTYIREGFLEIEDTFKKDSYFFLFSDVLLFVKYKPSEETGKEFKFKEIFYLDQVVDVSDILSDDDEEASSGTNEESIYQDEDGNEILRKSCNGSSSKSNLTDPIYSFEIETTEFSLVLLAESHNEKIEWMDDLRSCLQHNLIKDEDQLSSLSLSDNDDIDELNNNCNNSSNGNGNNGNFEQQLQQEVEEAKQFNQVDDEDEDDEEQFESNKINNIDGPSSNGNGGNNRNSVSFKTHRRLESEETYSDTESDDYELGKFKKQPPRKITFSEQVETIDS